MVGLHVLIGIGEGIITAATVGAVAAIRPDLVYLLRGTGPRRWTMPARRGAHVVNAAARQPARTAAPPRSSSVSWSSPCSSPGGLSYFASPHPDGLDSVTLKGCQVTEVDGAEQLDGTCIAQNAQRQRRRRQPARRLRVGGGDGTVGLAGVIGVLVTLVVAGGLFWLLRRRGRRTVRRR